MKTKTKALVSMATIALALTAFVLPAFADPIRARDNLQEQDCIRDPEYCNCTGPMRVGLEGGSFEYAYQHRHRHGFNRGFE